MKKFTNYLMLLVIAVLLPNWAMAQRRITGVVTDANDGSPLIAASVLITGTNDGTTTDGEGRYSIDVPDGATSLTFSYVGYREQVVELGVSNVVDVSMSSGSEFDEVLVIGYGEVTREDATGAVQAITSKDFNQGAITSTQDLIAGKLAGVNITPSTDPGGGADIQIRGLASFGTSSSPLIVVDGVPLEGNNTGGGRNALNFINPNDIESISVLKDASATSIYGSRATNGVILITTKKGSATAKFSISYNGNISMNSNLNQVDMLSADEFRSLVVNNIDRVAGDSAENIGLLGDANTNWQDEIYQNAFGTDHNVNFTGGIKGLPYRASIGYTNKQGVLIGEKFQRTTAAINVNPRFLDNTLQVNFSAKAMFTQNQFADRGAIGSAVDFNPTMPVYSEDSIHQARYAGYFTYTQPTNGLPLSLSPTNPVALLDRNLRRDDSDVQRYVVNGSVDYRMPFLPELRANLSLGIDEFRSKGEVFSDTLLASAIEDTGYINNYEINNRNRVLEFYLNYAKEYDFGKIDLMAGYSWQHFYFNDSSLATNFTGNQIYNSDDNPREYYLVSLYTRLNYTYNNLLLTFTLRRDGSSRFSETTRWGLFPSAAAAYKIVENGKGALKFLKLRVGYGVTGQQDIGNDFAELYPYLPLYDASQPTAQYQLGGQFYTTQRPRGYDLNVKWEETATYNFAVDFGLFNDRITGSLDYYQRYTSDIINLIKVPAGSNFTNEIRTNIGDMQNNGIELQLSTIPYRNASKNLTWELGFNATYEQNEITRMIANEGDTSFIGQFTGDIAGINNKIQVNQVGYPIATFFAYEQLYNEDGTPIEGAYGNFDGDTTGGNSNLDRVYGNNSNPTWFFGINTRLTYGNWELSLSGRAKFGNFIYNNVLAEKGNFNRLKGNTPYLSNVHAQTEAIDFQEPQLLSDYYITKGSFFRLDYVTLGYTFPELGQIKNLRLFLNVQNVFLVTNYEGLDPENGSIDNAIFPRSRAFVFGASATF